MLKFSQMIVLKISILAKIVMIMFFVIIELQVISLGLTF